MKTLNTSLVVLIGLAALVLGACGGGGGSSGGGFTVGGGTVNPYDIQPVGPPATGAQVNRPFSITVNFFAAGTVTPINVPGNETIHCTLLSGPGTLSGTVSLPGNNTSSLTFSNLILSAQGAYVLNFGGANATATVSTPSFNVGAQMDLHFSTVPTGALVNRNFTVAVQTVQPGTTTPVTPASPVAVTLALTTGTGTLAGTTTVNTSGSTATFSVSYNLAQVITLRATAFGFPPITSGNITVDSVVLSFATPPASVLVNGTFSLTVNLTGQISGTPISPSPPIQGSLVVATGSGTLAGNTTNISSSGSTIVFNNLTYNQIGAATFTASSPNATASVTSPTINFIVNLTVTATGPTTVLPNASFSPFNFRVVDGTGATWTGASGPLSWVLTNSASATVQSGSVPITAGVASVTPAPIATAGSYTLTGSITNPNAASANIGISVSSLTFINQPGPFVALKTCRVGTPYSDSVSFAAPNTATSYGLMSGSLPAGLTLTTANGTISGTPTTAGSYSFTLYAQLSGSNAQPIRCALAVFSVAETEIVSGQNFSTAGPYTPVGPTIETYTFTSSYDNVAYPTGAFACRVQFYYPNFATAPSPAPVFVQHRGRGFCMVDYDNMGSHLASHGFIFCSVEDFQSFADGSSNFGGGGGSGQSPNSTYDGTAERGMQSGSAFQEAILNWVIAKNSQTGHVLQNRVDVDKIFVGGHSRGGGATHGSHVRSQPYMFNGTQRQNINVRGVVYFMGFDLRYFSSTQAGSSTVYPVATAQPRLPSLVVAAEEDQDLTYPICDQFIDRATGQTTFATIYGGCHNYLGDNNWPEDDIYVYYGYPQYPEPWITRAQQQASIFNLVVAFLKRWSNLDLSLEGMLYNNQMAGSSSVGVTAYRNMMETTLVDNFQNGSTTSNTLGGANSISGGGSVSEASSIYPSVGSMSSMALRHGIFSLPASTTTTYNLNIPAASQNQSRAKRLVFRVGTVDITAQALKGFDWVTVRVRVTGGSQATVTLFDRSAPNTNYLPDYTGTQTVYDRFVDASIPLASFTGVNTSAITSVELIFETAAGVTRQLYVDDIRFE